MSALTRDEADPDVAGITFDPEKYMIDTVGLTLDERGALMMLRMAAEHRGHAFLTKESEIMRTLGIVRHQWKRMAPRVLPLIRSGAGEVK